MVCLNVDIFKFILLGFPSVHQMYTFIVTIKFGKFFSKYSFNPIFFFSPSVTPIMYKIVLLVVFQRILRFRSSFFILYSFCFSHWTFTDSFFCLLSSSSEFLIVSSVLFSSRVSIWLSFFVISNFSLKFSIWLRHCSHTFL